ncbi:MAG TPA: thioredoxin domain-containing protein [Oculatellaceae cyanobacterium]
MSKHNAQDDKQVHSHKTEGARANRLIDESSTYLKQHAYNPVDWYPWSAEALQESRQTNKPILLSIGYSACHWCHVMAHESFENDATAELMNKYFVNIKVDREERTDLDEIYMKAVQMMTGHGGWPMTVFLTPDLKPFFGGTYFPPTDRHGMPGFPKLLKALAKAWEEQREDIVSNSEELTQHLISMERLPRDPDASESAINPETIENAVEKLLKTFDSKWGGFGGAPKFPHSFSLNLAMRYIKGGGDRGTKENCVELVRTSLDRMADGGIHDQIGGGFARYSTDREWLVPHFEKMLYDNALLAVTYIDGYLLFGRDYWKRAAEKIFEFVLAELRTKDGAFYSSLDADSDGEEGKFYVWTEKELKEILTPTDFAFVRDLFAVTEHGNFEHGTNVLHLHKPLEEILANKNLKESELWMKFEGIRQILLREREQRVRPGRDEKVLTSWNSLMITAFVNGYRAFGEDLYLEAAKEAANFILRELVSDEGKLLRTWGDGKAKLNGYLDDYAYFTEALLEIASVDDDPHWFVDACRFAEAIISEFWDKDEDTLCYISKDHEQLISKPRSFYDGAIPSGTSVSIFCFLRIGKLTNDKGYLELAEKLLDQYASFAGKYPDQFSNLLCAMDFFLANGPEIVCLERANDEFYRDIAREHVLTINERYIPNKVVLIDSIMEGEKTSRLARELKDKLEVESPLLQGRGLIEGQPTIYICRDFACERPIFDMIALKEKIKELAAVDVTLKA